MLYDNHRLTYSSRRRHQQCRTVLSHSLQSDCRPTRKPYHPHQVRQHQHPLTFTCGDTSRIPFPNFVSKSTITPCHLTSPPHHHLASSSTTFIPTGMRSPTLSPTSLAHANKVNEGSESSSLGLRPGLGLLKCPWDSVFPSGVPEFDRVPHAEIRLFTLLF